MDNNIDRLFRKAFENQKCEPPAELWENIRKQLPVHRIYRHNWWLRGIAAVAIFAAGIGIWQLTEQKATEIVPFVEEIKEGNRDMKSPLYARPVTAAEEQRNTPVFPASTQRIVTVSSGHSASIQRKRDTGFLQIRKADWKELPTESDLQLISRKLPQALIPLTSGEALKNNLIYQNLLAEKPQEKNGKKKFRLALSGHFIPAYSSGSYSSSVKNSRGIDYSKNQMDGLMNTGGGLKLTLGYGKRFAVQTGIFYSRMGQKTTENYGNPHLTTYGLSSSGQRMATPLGNIKIRRKAVAYRSSEAVLLNQIGNTVAEEALEQVFGTLEIPLKIKYRLNNNKVLFSVNGGFCGNFIVDNKVYFKSSNRKELLGSTEDIRNFNISMDWGIGVEYPLGSKIKIMVEPGVKYYLQSLSRNESIDYKPYIFSLSTGIGIDF